MQPHSGRKEVEGEQMHEKKIRYPHRDRSFRCGLGIGRDRVRRGSRRGSTTEGERGEAGSRRQGAGSETEGRKESATSTTAGGKEGQGSKTKGRKEGAGSKAKGR